MQKKKEKIGKLKKKNVILKKRKKEKRKKEKRKKLEKKERGMHCGLLL